MNWKEALGLGAKRVICLTKNEAQIQFIEATAEGDRVRAHNFAVIPDLPKDPAKIAELLRKFLADKEIKTKTVYACLESEDIKYKRILVPVMGRAQLMTAVRQAAAKEAGKPVHALRIDFRVVQEIQDRGVKRLDVLVCAGPKEQYDAFEDILLRARLQPAVVTTLRAGMSYSPAHRKRNQKLPNEVQAYVYLTPEYSVMTFLQEGWYVFSRGFITPKMEERPELEADFFMSKNRDASAGPVVSNEKDKRGTYTRELSGEELFRVSTEISRSIRFFQQNYRDYSISQLIMCGRTVDLDALRGALGSVNFTIHAYSKLAQAEFPKSEKYVNSEKVAQYAGELALLYGIPVGERPNFVPPPTPIRKYRVPLGAFSVAALAVCMVGITHFFALADDYRGRRAAIEAQVAQHQAEIQRLQADKQFRDENLAIAALVEEAAVKPLAFNPLPLQELSWMVGDGLQFTRVRMSRSAQGWTGEILGAATGPSADLVKQRFNQFFENGRMSPLLSSWESKPFRIRESESTFTLDFEVKFQMSNDLAGAPAN